ncbi:hypothetical protein MKW94_024252 [Papaver nudicaule]|uniref:HMG box domain-containing protein n=1 Tax=Papaver nudicaule TaxID=74823 RepID=A0AA41VGR6_PAPNU|nr:hypothetical protein [Papaver nudicaule]
MANLVRNRKRVFPLRRAPDGSAFLKCDLCGVSVAIAIYDMHECKKLKQARKGGKQRCESFSGDDQRKALKCEDGSNNGEKSFSDQPRSAFCFFMESLQKGNFIHVDRNGFEKWKCMSDKERSPFVLEAEKVNSAYENILLKEVQIEPLMDDEADSAKVNKFDWDVDESDDIWWQSEMYRLQTGFSSSWIDDTLDRLW